MTTRPVALCSDRRIEQVRSLTEQCVEAWRLKWGVSFESTVALSGFDPDLHDWNVPQASWVAGSDTSLTAILRPIDLGCRISEALFGARDEAWSLALEAGEHLAQDLIQSMLHAWGADGSPRLREAPPSMSRWLSPVRVEVHLAGVAVLQALVSAAGCTLPGPDEGFSGKSLSPTGRQPFNVLPAQASVRVGSAQVSVPDAAALHVGDVIVLDSLVHEPLELRLSSESAAVRVFLCRVGADRAALIVPAAT